MLTVLDVLKGATDYLGKKGVESPRLNAEWLLAHVLGKSRMELYLEFDRPLGETERGPLRALVRSRGEGRPLQHLLGEVEFLGRRFATDERALIPRPETEQFVELVVGKLRGFERPRILDVGTGSGVIAVSLALEFPGGAVEAVDVSAEAIALAQENALRHGAQVVFRRADLLEGAEGPFDLVIANLPYVPAGEIAALAREVRHDPVLALDGGLDGMDLLRTLIVDASSVLGAPGLLALEIGHDQANPLLSLLEANNYRDIHAVADYQGVQRFLFAQHG